MSNQHSVIAGERTQADSRSARKPDTTEPKSPEQIGHTPGPWRIDPTGDVRPWLVGTSQVEIANCAGSDVDQAEMEANARLIAVAPELYQACKSALHVITLLEDQYGVITSNSNAKLQLRAVLSKVEERNTH